VKPALSSLGGTLSTVEVTRVEVRNLGIESGI
jgi:hypothetical protein